VLATPGQARIYAAKRERDCILKHLQRSLKKKKEEESFVELDLPGRLITTALVRLREAEDSVAFFEAELKIKNANLARARQESEPGYDHDFYQTLLEYKTIDGNGFYFMINTKAWEGGCESDDGYHLPF
jgi:hypothetical protein